jgi:hypothetical protein
MNDFNYLPFNKNFGYKSPISDEICRTGTLKDDSISSFLNAVLYGCSIKFNILKDDEKLEKIKELKDFIISRIKDSESFKNYLSDISDKFFEILNKIKNFINDEEEIEDSVSFVSKIKPNIELYKIIIELITIDDYVKIVKKTLRNCTDNKFKTFRHNIMIETIKFIDYEDILEDVDEERVKYIKKSVCYFIDLILDEINIEEPTVPDVVTPQIIKLASKYFDNCDIYFIDWETKLPTIIDGYKHSNSNNSIILLTFHNSHFEIIGKTIGIDSETKKHKIKREFMPFDDIIKSINFYLDKKDREN